MTRILKSKPGLYEGWGSMPDQPKDCYVCGKPVRFSKDAAGYRTSEPKQTWHMACVTRPTCPTCGR